MAENTRKCKVCGKEYPYCKTAFVPGSFRYQDVACCAEHGQEYLARVIDSRTEKTSEPEKKVETVIKTTRNIEKKSFKKDKSSK
jgi:hypothetical protein